MDLEERLALVAKKLCKDNNPIKAKFDICRVYEDKIYIYVRKNQFPTTISWDARIKLCQGGLPRTDFHNHEYSGFSPQQLEELKIEFSVKKFVIDIADQLNQILSQNKVDAAEEKIKTFLEIVSGFSVKEALCN
ncbi:MAG TPA: hypothetical protein V6D09_25710 [Leptolyngbyaceae cyanobacterium]